MQIMIDRFHPIGFAPDGTSGCKEDDDGKLTIYASPQFFTMSQDGQESITLRRDYAFVLGPREQSLLGRRRILEARYTQCPIGSTGAERQAVAPIEVPLADGAYAITLPLVVFVHSPNPKSTT